MATDIEKLEKEIRSTEAIILESKEYLLELKTKLDALKEKEAKENKK